MNSLLPHLLNTALSPQYITRIARIAKRTLFPNGYLVPSPPDPTPEEQRALKERLLKWRPRGALCTSSCSSCYLALILLPLSSLDAVLTGT